MSTHYEILQVSETASLDIIKQQFQQLILQVRTCDRQFNGKSRSKNLL
jgi:hypothetical protein